MLYNETGMKNKGVLMMTLIDVKNVMLGYDNHIVIDDISFKVEDGDFICLVGENGSGKSTLVKGLLGILKPIKGEIKYVNLKKNFIGYIPQETLTNRNFPASVLEIVMSGNLNRCLKYSKKDKERAINALIKLDILKLKDKSFKELSGGERQKVFIARALVSTSKLLILDEPSNNLDYNSRTYLYTLLEKLNKEDKLTIIMITHDLDHSNLIGNKILKLDGKTYHFEDTKDYIKETCHVK